MLDATWVQQKSGNQKQDVNFGCGKYMDIWESDANHDM